MTSPLQRSTSDISDYLGREWTSLSPPTLINDFVDDQVEVNSGDSRTLIVDVTSPRATTVPTPSTRRVNMGRDNIIPENCKLTGEANYSTWSFLMQNILQDRDEWEFCITPPPPPATQTAEEIKLRAKANSTLNLSVHIDLVEELRQYTNCYDCWKGLRELYASNNPARRLALWRKLGSTKMLDAETLETHIRRLKALFRELANVDLSVPTEIKVMILLDSLPSSYLGYVQAISARDSSITFAQLETKLLAEESRMKLQPAHQPAEQVLMVKGKTNIQRYKPPAQRDSHHGPSSANKGGSSSRSENWRSNDRKPNRRNCRHCGQPGHDDKDCPITILEEKMTKMLSAYKQTSRRTHSAANLVEQPSASSDSESDADLASSTADACITEVTHHISNICALEADTPWILDSGATSHVTGQRSLLSGIQRTSHIGSVRTAGGQIHTVHGTGRTNLTLPSGNVTTIQDILYVPGIKKNLLSVGAIADSGAVLIFSSDKCHILDEQTHQTLATASRSHASDLYRLDPGQHSSSSSFQEAEANTVSAAKTSLTKLWHSRLGHLHPRKLHDLSVRQPDLGIPPLPIITLKCSTCYVGKQKRDNIPKVRSNRATATLDLVYADLCGPFKTASLSGARYFLLFVDDFSRRMWVYFLRQKSEAFTKFQIFKTRVEAETGLRLRALKTDNGGEFTSRAFQDYCHTHGISKVLSQPYSSYQNGVVERRNRSLLEMARCMTLNRNLPAYLWAEAVNYACFVQNRVPCKANPMSTPETLYSTVSPNLSKLREFGSIAYVHIPSVHRDKLSSKTLKCVFVGIEETTHLYRCLDLDSRKIHLTRDVKFHENEILPPDTHTPMTIEYPIFLSGSAQNHSSSPLLPPIYPDSFNSSTPANPDNLGTPPPVPDNLSTPLPIDLASPFPLHTHTLSTPSPISPQLQVYTRRLTRPYPAPAQPTRRSERTIKFPSQYNEFICNLESLPSLSDPRLLETCTAEPTSYAQASLIPGWVAAMQDEIDSIHKAQTWILVSRPLLHPVITSRWLYKVKPGPAGHGVKLKARLVARGFQQQEGVDYYDTFAPVVRWGTVRTIFALAAHFNWLMQHLDVKTAFLNGDLEEQVFMEQPQGYATPGQGDLVCLLKKALYGLKQAGRAWHIKIDRFLKSLGLLQSHYDGNLYYLKEGTQTLLLILYVDDLLVTGDHTERITWLIQQLLNRFEMTNLGQVTRYLGLELAYTPTGIFIHQTTYAQSIIRDCDMETCNPSHVPMNPGTKLITDMDSPATAPQPYRKGTGKLHFLCNTRPDITFPVNVTARYMQAPQTTHLKTMRGIIRYVKQTPNFGLFYPRGTSLSLLGFSDADWAGCTETRRSTSGYIFTLGGCPISWNSKRQPTVATSSTEAEYRALMDCAKEAVWLRHLIIELGFISTEPTLIFVDNLSCIKIVKNPVFHNKTKHFELHYHYSREKSEENCISVSHMPTGEQPADILTKPLGRNKFEECRTKIGVFQIPASTG
jgi:transposase InsO family protein